MFKSPTYGKLHIEQIPDKILTFYLDHTKYDAPVHIIVGTDSQNFDDTKIVSVVAVICEGHGGMFFYEITRRALIRDVRTRRMTRNTKRCISTARSPSTWMRATAETERPEN